MVYREAIRPFAKSVNRSIGACWKRYRKLEDKYGGAWKQQSAVMIFKCRYACLAKTGDISRETPVVSIEWPRSAM